MWRIGVNYKNGTREAINKETKEDCEEWLLSILEKKKVTKAIIVNKENIKEREIINF